MQDKTTIAEPSATLLDIPIDVIRYLLANFVRLIDAVNFKTAWKIFNNHPALADIKLPRNKIAAYGDHALIVDENRLALLSKQFLKKTCKNINQQFDLTSAGIPRLIASGSQHHIVLNGNGDLEGFGNGQCGRLGLGMKKIALATTQNSLSTILLPGERKAKRISAGGNHTLVLTTDDRVCVFGENPCGQLGLGDRKPRYKPVFLGLPKDCIPVKIFAGDLNSFIIDDKQRIFAFGKLVGEYKVYMQETPCQIAENLPAGIIQIVSGLDHTLLLHKEGTVYSFGDNRCGQLGYQGTPQTDTFPSELHHSHYPDTPQAVTFLSGIEVIKIAAGGCHSAALTVDNVLYIFGINILVPWNRWNKDYTPPQRIEIRLPLGVKITDLVANNNSILLQCSNEQILVLGKNIFGNLLEGDYFTTPTLLPKLMEQKAGQKRTLDENEASSENPKPKRRKHHQESNPPTFFQPAQGPSQVKPEQQQPSQNPS